MPRAPGRRIASSNRRNRRNIRRRKGAKAQQQQLLTINKNIARLNRAVGLTKQFAQYSQNWSGLIGYNIINGPASINSPSWVAKGFNVYELNLPGDPIVPTTNGPSTPGWSPVFQATSEVDNANKFFHEKTNLKLSFQFQELVVQTSAQLDGQYQRIPALPKEITIFVVSFKRKAFQQAKRDFFNGDGYWDGDKWNALTGSRYWKTTNNFVGQQESLPMLNKGVFNIHHYKRFRIGGATSGVNHNPGPPDNPILQIFTGTTNLRDNYRTLSLRIDGTGLLKSTTGDTKWKALTAPELPSGDRKFLMVHVSGNSLADGTSLTGTQAQVIMTANAVHVGRGTN